MDPVPAQRAAPAERLIADLRAAAAALLVARAAQADAVAAFHASVQAAYAGGLRQADLHTALADYDEIHPLPAAAGTDDANGELEQHPPWGVVLSVLTDQWLAMCYLCGWRGEPAERHDEALPELRSHLTSARHARSMRDDGA